MVEGTVQSIQNNIGIQASAEFTTLHGAPNDLTGDLATGLNPTRADCLAQILVGLRPAEQWPEDFTQPTTVCFPQKPHRRRKAFASSRAYLDWSKARDVR